MSTWVSAAMAGTVSTITGGSVWGTAATNTINTIYSPMGTSLYSPFYVSREEYDKLAAKVRKLEKLLNVEEKRISKYDI